MWTDITRSKHARKGLRYSSDLTDGNGRFWGRLFRRPRGLAGR